MPGSLIIAGTGDPEDLVRSAESLLANPDEVVLVAPMSPDRGAAALTALKVPGERRHFDGLLGAEPGEAELVRYNLPGLQSTKPPSRSLRDLFPGLSERSRKSVARHSVIEVLTAGGGLPTPVNLRLGDLGSEAEIVTALEDHGLLDRLGKVSLRCGREAMFEGSWSCSQIQEWLTERHFRLEAIDESDPDFHELILVREAAAAKIAQLESHIVALGAARQADLAEVMDRLNAAEKQAVGAESRVAESEKQLTLRAAELDAQAKSHASQVAHLEAQLAEREKQLTLRAAELDAQAKSHASQIAHLEAQIEKNTRVKADLEQKLKAAEKELSNNRADLSLALKMQALLSADIQFLREKLRTSELERESHQDLLRRLTPKLHQAASQIREMHLIDTPSRSRGRSELAAVGNVPAAPNRKGRRKR